MDRNADFLRQMASRLGLNADQLAALCRVSRSAAISWLRPDTSAAHRDPPHMAIELLCLKLGEPLPDFLTDQACMPIRSPPTDTSYSV